VTLIAYRRTVLHFSKFKFYRKSKVKETHVFSPFPIPMPRQDSSRCLSSKHVSVIITLNLSASISVLKGWRFRPMQCSACVSVPYKQTPWPLVRKRTIPTERLPIVDKNLMPSFVDRGLSRGQRGRSPTAVNLSFLDRSR
jgi:hypothetical protein